MERPAPKKPPPPPPPKKAAAAAAAETTEWPDEGRVLCGSHYSNDGCKNCGKEAGWCNGECKWKEGRGCMPRITGPRIKIHPELKNLIREYPYQPVRTDRGELTNIILVRSPFRSARQEQLYHKYKKELLFVGISSFEDYPLPPENPFSAKFPVDKYTGLFPGFLHMMHEDQAKKYFPPEVKLLLMSQSDFSLPGPFKPMKKKWDFTLSGSDQDVWRDCVGWSSFAKNWSFVKEALEVMCSEFKMTGVLVATRAKSGDTKCSIPKSCDGLMLQTRYLNQNEFFDYQRQSRFGFLPQIHDASPRVSSQALGNDIPILMNRNIMGGWKYVNDKTGEFFHDMSDFRDSLRRIMQGVKDQKYEPRKWVTQNYGDKIQGERLYKWIKENFADNDDFPLKLPEGITALYPAGA